jgi:hypothetical protein
MDQNYLLQQVFFVRVTGLLWQKMSDWSDVAKMSCICQFQAFDEQTYIPI